MDIKNLFSGIGGEREKDGPKRPPVTKDMIIGDLLEAYPETAELLMQCGMGCISCPASLMESLEEASMVHGLKPDEVVEYLNEEMELI